MHPLTPNLSELTDIQLDEKILDLSKKLNFAHRMGKFDLIQQIQMMMSDYQEEKRRRQDKVLEDLNSKSKDFKSLIDVNK